MSNDDFVSFCTGIYKTMFKDILGESWDFNKMLRGATEMMLKAEEGQNRFAYPTIQTFVRLVAWIAQQVTGVDKPAVFLDLLEALRARVLFFKDTCTPSCLFTMRR